MVIDKAMCILERETAAKMLVDKVAVCLEVATKASS